MQPFFFGLGLACMLAVGAFALSPTARRVTVWGALIGLAAGFWGLAPRVLRAHHLDAVGVAQWIVLDMFFAGTFLAIGGVLAALTSFPLAVYAGLRRGHPRCPVLATALWSAALLPVAYFALSALLAFAFLRLPGLREFAPWFWPAFVAYVTALLGGAVYYARRARRRDLTRRRLRILLGGCAAVGMIALPWRGAASPPPEPPAAPLIHRSTAALRTPLLVVGLDGGDWRTLQPVIDRGGAPTLARLVATGLRGQLEALRPPYWSTPAWGAILTGQNIDRIGVHGDMSATVPRLPTFELPLAIDASLNPLLLIELALIHAHVIEPHPASRDQLRAPPVWERLHMAGVRVATIHFPFTYPARDQATYVISDRVVTDLWEMVGVTAGDRDAIISPPARVERTLAWFSGSAGADPDVLRQIFPQERWPQPRDALVDPVATLGHVLDSSQRMFGATRQLLADDPSLAVLLLYVPDLDTVSHAFWPYRHPEDFPDDPPSPADVAVLGPVIDKYVTYLDRSIAAVMASFPSPPDVLIVADHGEGPARGLTTLWRGWHAREAAVLAAGPDIPHRESLIDLTYYDIVPTILDLTGFRPAPDLGGHSIVTTR